MLVSLPKANGVTSNGTSNRYENILVLLLAISAGLVFLDRFGIAFVFPQIRADLHLDNAQLGSIMAVTSLTWAISSIVFSFLSDALGGRAKLIIVLCMIGFSLTTGLVGIVTTFAGLLAVRGIMGVSEGPAVPLMQSAVVAASSPHRVGMNMGIVIGGVALLGGALPPVLMVMLTSAFGWRHAFLYLAIPGIVLALLITMIMKPDSLANANRAPSDQAMRRANLHDALRLFRNPNVILALIGSVALISFTVTITSFMPLFLANSAGISLTMRTTILTLFGLLAGAGTIVVPMISDKLKRKPCLIAATACTALVPLSLILLRVNYFFIIPFLALQFASGGAFTLMVYIIPGETVPPRLAATTFALLVSIGEIAGGASGPPVAGILADHFGLITAILFCSGLGTIAFAASLWIREPNTNVNTFTEANLS